MGRERKVANDDTGSTAPISSGETYFGTNHIPAARLTRSPALKAKKRRVASLTNLFIVQYDRGCAFLQVENLRNHEVIILYTLPKVLNVRFSFLRLFCYVISKRERKSFTSLGQDVEKDTHKKF